MKTQQSRTIGDNPAMIGRYRILRVLGEGGMGVVYLAEQEHPNRVVALKVIKPGFVNHESLLRFEQEARLLGRLQHPGIAQIYEAGTADSDLGPQHYFAMELIEGVSLRDYASARNLKLRARLELMAKICDAVNHAHQRGIIHRDLKPGNILVDDSVQPKILDFGVARLTDVEATRHTDMGQLIGTLNYMSPEQMLDDSQELDIRSDVYALGVIAYELLAGRLPYAIHRKPLPEVVRVIQEQDPAPLSSIDRIYRGDVETIIAKALEKDKSRRYASAAEMAADIRHYLADEPIVARPPSASYQLQKFARRHRTLVAGAAAVLVVLIAGVVVSTWQAVKARRAEASAQAVNDFLQNDLLAQASAAIQSGPNTKPDPDLKVRTALDRAAEKIEGKFDQHPQVEGAIRDTIGQTYFDLGLYPEAHKQLERALELHKQVEGADNPKTLNTASRLAEVIAKQGNFREAEAEQSRTLESMRRVLGSENRDTLRCMSNLASVYSFGGKYSQAESLYNQVLEIDGRVLGPENPDTLKAAYGLANVYYLQGKFAQTEALYIKTLEIDRRVLGPEHPETLRTMYNLAVTYAGEHKVAEAEALSLQTLELDRKVLGPEHPDTLWCMNSLANLYGAEGKFAQSEALHIQNLEIERRVFGPDHPDTVKTMYNLASVYNAQGKYAKTEALLAPGLETYRKALGPEHPRTLGAMADLAEAYNSEGKYAQAEAFYSQILEIDRRVYGPESGGTLASMDDLAGVYSAEGKYAQAETLSSKAWELERGINGPDNPGGMGLMTDLATIYNEEGKYAPAETLLRQALPIRRRYSGPDHPTTIEVEAELALVFMSQGKFTESESLARDAETIERTERPDDWLRFWAESLLGESLAGEKDYAAAEPLLLDGYRGMRARKDRVPVSYGRHVDSAHQWIIEMYQASGKPQKAVEWRHS